jgi:hypothetical protein
LLLFRQDKSKAVPYLLRCLSATITAKSSDRQVVSFGGYRPNDILIFRQSRREVARKQRHRLTPGDRGRGLKWNTQQSA